LNLEEKKTILLISPQPWGVVFVSKHHYAIELEQLGYRVYFLNPPSKNCKSIVEIMKPYEEKNLFVINSSFANNLFLRYHLGIIYSFLVKNWVNKVLKKLPVIDIVWCFETNIFRSLSIFKKVKKIFHVVDPINEKQTVVSKSADLTVCISNRILKQFNGISVKKIFINHALSGITIQKAKGIEFSRYLVSGRLSAGYIGNLSRAIIDTETIYTIVQENQEIDFHFWGPGAEGNLGGETHILIESLKHLDNVIFHHPIPSVELIDVIQDVDIFLLAYKKIKGAHDASNAHKILEYLATGKVVVSTYIDQYSSNEFENYIQMSPEDENSKLPQVFKNVVDNMTFWNNKYNLEMRRDFAINNSYKENVTRILALINE